MILEIIRKLGKVDALVLQENQNIYKLLPCCFKSLIINTLKFMKGTLITSNTNEKVTVISLEKINKNLVKLESPNIIAYTYYFLGCFYYKINNYTTAIEYLKKCKDLKPSFNIKNSACGFLDNIWDNQIRPSTWNWWLHSPLNCWTKKISFIILILSRFGILLPSITSEIVLLVYNSVLKLMSNYQPILNFPNIESIISSVFLLVYSFFSSINWRENTIQFTFLTLIILFILISANLQHFKGSEIEIELVSPSTFELTPSMIEEKLESLESL